MLRSTLLVSLCLAVLARPAGAAGEAEFLAGQSKACVKCALGKISMKRRELGGIDLAGADLAKAVFHRSRLIGANFAGADLTGANLNKTDLKNASFVDIKGAGAMFYESDLSVADFTGADLVEANPDAEHSWDTRIREAMMFFWICEVPPMTLCARL